MTRQEQKEEKEKRELEFLKNKDMYYSECFIKNDDFYKMMDILKSSESRGVVKEYGFELHHGVPRSYFKKKHMTVIDKNNLFKLTYSEHFMVHYYAYKCASPFLKSSMTLALIQMKRVCAKNTDEYDTILLSKIFESIKLDLYNDRKKQEKVKTFQKAKEKFDKKLNKSWYRIIKEHTVIKVPMFTDVFKLLLDLKYQNPELLEFIFQFIELAKKQNLSEECLDVMLNTSIEELDKMIQINDGKDICDYKKEAKNFKK